MADVLERISYQQESMSIQSSLLAAAYELHNGIPKGATTKSPGPDMVRAMTTELWLGFPGVRLGGAKANRKAFKINLLTPFNSEKCVVELGNRTLTSIQGFQYKNAELTITINREDLVQTMMGAATFDDQTSFGKAKLNGDRNSYEERNSMLFHFDLGFEMMPGTGSKDLTPVQKLFEQE